jgi:hypothetical protein
MAGVEALAQGGSVQAATEEAEEGIEPQAVSVESDTAVVETEAGELVESD